ncbi:MAG: transcriptional regulator domain-containing protein [Stellaceae bacterium]
MPTPDWRSPAAYEYVSGLTLAGLAWEFLRRNPDYRSDYQRKDGKAPLRAVSRVARDDPGRCWGLRFPRRPRQKR